MDNPDIPDTFVVVVVVETDFVDVAPLMAALVSSKLELCSVFRYRNQRDVAAGVGVVAMDVALEQKPVAGVEVVDVAAVVAVDEDVAVVDSRAYSDDAVVVDIAHTSVADAAVHMD